MIIEDWRGHLAWMFEESERTGKFLAFDAYAGLGGWDSGLDAEGFLVMGCEIDPKIAELNPYPMICADFTTLNPGDFKGFDLIVGSPPCRNFTKIPDHVLRADGEKWSWKNPKNPVEGLKLVNAYLSFVEAAKPRYWLMENVPNLCNYTDVKPRCISYLTPSMRRAFFGNFPDFLVPVELGRKKIFDFGGPLRAWERAKIPLPVARALGVAVKQALEESIKA